LHQNIEKFDARDKNCMNLLSVHKLYEEFVSIFVNVVNRHAPLQQMTIKKRRLNNKPWLSIALKNQLI